MAKNRPDLHSLTQSEIADLLNLSTRQVHNLVQRDPPGVKVVDGKKTFDGPVFLKWYWEWKVDEAVKKASPPDEWDAQARLHAAKAEMTELDLAERRRQLLSADYVADQLERIAGTLKDAVLTLSGKAQRFVGLKSPAEAKAALRELEADLLRRLSSIGSTGILDDEKRPAA